MQPVTLRMAEKGKQRKMETIFERLFKLGLLESPQPPEPKPWREIFPETPPPSETVSVETIAFLRGRGEEDEEEE